MTKAEKATLQEIMNGLTEYEKMRDEAFTFLQDRNQEVTGTAWCSALSNYKDLLAAGESYDYKYEIYVKASAKIEMLTKLGSALADLNFWK